MPWDINYSPEQRAKFITLLRDTCNVSVAAKGAGLDRSTVYQVRRNDPIFAAEWDDALEQAYDELEAEARRRAFKGYLEPVFYKGDIVGHVRKFSDSLAITMLGAYRAKFRRQQVEVSGPDGAPIPIDDKTAAARIAALLAAARARKDELDDIA